MQVTVSAHDQDVARRVTEALIPLCDILATRIDQDVCKLSLAPGVVVAEFWSKDGAGAKVPVGIRALAAALAAGKIALLADLLCRRASRKQREQRRRGLVRP